MDASMYTKPQPWVSQAPLHKNEKDFPLSPDTVDLPMKSQHQVTCQPKHVHIIMWQNNALQSLFVHNVILNGCCCLSILSQASRTA